MSARILTTVTIALALLLASAAGATPAIEDAEDVSRKLQKKIAQSIGEALDLEPGGRGRLLRARTGSSDRRAWKKLIEKEIDVKVEDASLPLALELLPSVPNPFRSHATIRFRTGGTSIATLAIYDVGGRLVHQLTNPSIGPGAHAFDWDGTDSSGKRVPAGVYFYRVRASGLAAGDKLVRVD